MGSNFNILLSFSLANIEKALDHMLRDTTTAQIQITDPAKPSHTTPI